MPRQRHRIKVQGIVQGVGFRPFVYGLAQRYGLVGYVRNDTTGVQIEVEGEAAAVDLFTHAVAEQPPPLARIEQVGWEAQALQGETNFVIQPSEQNAARQALVSPDVALCADCLHELFDPNDRRYLYPFINCTNCGPRFTIIGDVPYDRAKTTMQPFPLCAACQAEYDDPMNRRFHAQPNACPACGPIVDFGFWIYDLRASSQEDGAASDGWSSHPRPLGAPAPQSGEGTGKEQEKSLLLPNQWPPPSFGAQRREPFGCRWGGVSSADSLEGEASYRNPIESAAQHLAAGAILAVKGLGGYHLVCDALNPEAVRRLRQRKQRAAKPFAVMVPNLATARQLCQVSAAEAELLQSQRRPIVLLAQTPGCPIAPEVAPAHNTLGLLLPYTPLHYVLLRAFANAVGPDRPTALVMTSGNLSDEPLAYLDEEAQTRLAPLVDGWLIHNRAIQTRCDDSVVRSVAGGEQILRRARGYAPQPIRLAQSALLPVLACGGHLKNTFCLVKGNQAFVSQHIGDLENLETLRAYRTGIDHYQRLFDIQPEVVAYDLHPDYLATQYAQEFVGHHLVGIQHHHAHIASVMAEHELAGPVIGVAADGSGYGTDEAVWGGEIMIATLQGFERTAHLAYVPLPGGEQAIRQPWRMAAIYLAQAFGDDWLQLEIPFAKACDQRRWRPLAQMIERGLNSPLTSSLGRLFDAVAALLGVRNAVVYEGQAAIELEMVAVATEATYPFAIHDGQPMILDVAPLIRALVRDLQQGMPIAQIAGCFHNTIARLLATICLRVREQTGLNDVALSGGVFQNRLLLEQLSVLLEADGFQVYTNRRVPPNDGGLSLGQAAIAAACCVNPKGATYVPGHSWSDY